VKRKFHPGDCVRFTSKFLQSTGQYVGGEGRKKWSVVAHKCGLCDDGPRNGGQFVAVDEESYDDPSRPRHINVANLIRCKSPDYTGL